MLTALVETVDRIQEHMGNISREMEILRKNHKEKFILKITVTEKNAFDGLTGMLNMDEEKHL